MFSLLSMYSFILNQLATEKSNIFESMQFVFVTLLNQNPKIVGPIFMLKQWMKEFVSCRIYYQG